MRTWPTSRNKRRAPPQSFACSSSIACWNLPRASVSRAASSPVWAAAGGANRIAVTRQSSAISAFECTSVGLHALAHDAARLRRSTVVVRDQRRERAAADVPGPGDPVDTFLVGVVQERRVVTGPAIAARPAELGHHDRIGCREKSPIGLPVAGLLV